MEKKIHTTQKCTEDYISIYRRTDSNEVLFYNIGHLHSFYSYNNNRGIHDNQYNLNNRRNESSAVVKIGCHSKHLSAVRFPQYL